MHDYIKFSAKKNILTFSGNRHALLWFTISMYPAKLKARSESTDVASTHRYFFASFDNRGSLWLTVEVVYG